MNRLFFKRTFFTLILIAISSIIMMVITNIFFHDDREFFYNYIDFLFFATFPFFLIGSIMLIGESGMFGIFIYSANKVRSVLSSKYKYSLLESASIEADQIDAHLRNKYLNNHTRSLWTYPVFIGSATVLVALLIFTTIQYG